METKSNPQEIAKKSTDILYDISGPNYQMYLIPGPIFSINSSNLSITDNVLLINDFTPSLNNISMERDGYMIIESHFEEVNTNFSDAFIITADDMNYRNPLALYCYDNNTWYDYYPLHFPYFRIAEIQLFNFPTQSYINMTLTSNQSMPTTWSKFKWKLLIQDEDENLITGLEFYCRVK